MKKQIIRLTEDDIHNMIKTCVNEALNEMDGYMGYNDDGTPCSFGEDEPYEDYTTDYYEDGMMDDDYYPEDYEEDEDLIPADEGCNY